MNSKWSPYKDFEGKMKEKLQKSGGNLPKTCQDIPADVLARFWDIMGVPYNFYPCFPYFGL